MTDCRLKSLIILPLLLLAACTGRTAPTPVPTITVPPTLTPNLAPVGTYDCYGHEAGALAYTGRLEIRKDGSVEFLSRVGRWTFDEATQTLTFGGDTVLAQAEYRAERPRLSVDLQPDVNVVHAERGTMSCDPVEDR